MLFGREDYKKTYRFLYLPIETNARELESKMLLAVEAVRRGYAVLIGNKSIIGMMRDFPKGIFFYKDGGPHSSKIFSYVKKLGNYTVVHDEEGLVYTAESYFDNRLDSDALKHVDIFFCWGVDQYNLVTKAIDKNESQAKSFVVGNPRIDLLRMTRIKAENNSNNRNIIMVNTKFSSCNHVRGEKYLLKINNKYYRNNYQDYLQNNFEWCNETIIKYKEMIKILSDHFCTYDIVIRPHPSENKKYWVEYAKNFSNVYVKYDKSARYWMSRSNFVIHTGCTTGIESFMLDIPTIDYTPFNNPSANDNLPKQVSIIINDIEEVVSTINKIAIDKNIWSIESKDFDKVLSKHIYIDDDNYSYNIIMNCIDNLNVDTLSVDKKTINKYTVIKYVKNTTKYFINLFRKKEDVNNVKSYKVTIQDIKSISNEILVMLNCNINICIIEINSGVFMLHPGSNI